MLQHRVQDLHVVGVSGIRQLIKDDQLHHSTQVVSVGIKQLPRESQQKHKLVWITELSNKKGVRQRAKLYTPDTQHVVVE